MTKVLVPIAIGFEEVEAVTIIDILRRADIEVTTVGLSKNYVLGAHDIEIKVDKNIDDIDYNDFDMIALPGGMPGSLHLKQNSKVQQILKSMHEKKRYIGAICAAAIALDEAGVLKGSYTCYPSFEKKIENGNYISNLNVVCDENIITSKGPGFAIEFSLKIVEVLCGKNVSNRIKNELLL